MASNRLIKESSRYLLQHAKNPVDWYPWCPEAFNRAKKEKKPILLSIGYSSCHWCHVMEKESFEDPDVAAEMNERFISIKVDREERPDIDAIYMEAVQGLTGSGGWPLTVFLMPDGRPFLGGTYFPPISRGGLPSFTQLLHHVSQIYHEKGEKIEQAANELQESLGRSSSNNNGIPNKEIIQGAYVALTQSHDSINGGFGRAPKFPQPTTLDFLLRVSGEKGYGYASKIVELTLTKMAFGGIYDHLGGGFHRYSVDSRWMIPHFEKMLYDNALLSRVYLHAFQISKTEIFKKIAEETLDYVIREMTHQSGGFYSTQDADSEGEEGKYYLWKKSEIENNLTSKEAEVFCTYYGISETGNFEGDNILHVNYPVKKVASNLGMNADQVTEKIRSGREKLLTIRNSRVKPGTDDKMISSWNGLMLTSFAEAARILKRDDYRQIAESNAELILAKLNGEGGLLHLLNNREEKIAGYLEDYSFLIEGLITLYQTTFDPRWLSEALRISHVMVDYFEDKKNGGFYDTSDEHECLISRPKNIFDSAVPSGSSITTLILLKLHAYTGEKRFIEVATRAVKSACMLFDKYPNAFGSWLSSLNMYLTPPKELAIVGEPTSKEVVNMLDIFNNAYRPNVVIALQPPKKDYSRTIPLLNGKVQLNGKPTAYVCRNFSCDNPTNNPENLIPKLDQ